MLQLPEGANPGDFLTVIETVGQATVDGPLPARLPGTEDQAPSFGWAHADGDSVTLATIDMAPLRSGTDWIQIAATVGEAHYGEGGVVTSVARYLGTLHGLLPCDPAVYTIISKEARLVLGGERDKGRRYPRMLYIAQAALNQAYQETVSGRLPVY